MEYPPELISTLRSASRLAVLTGAGVSQESGLRTFRDAQAGLWSQYRPEDLATPEAFQRDPRLVWDWYAMRREKVNAAEPNPGHFALVALEQRIPHFTLITQNVDGLHQKAGSLAVIELHGNITRVKCSLCGLAAGSWQDNGVQVPSCGCCAGLLRPDVVWFGEQLPRAELEQAVAAARSCQVFFSVGTSGVVHPAAALAHAAKNNAAVVVEVNAEATPLTPRVDYALHGKSGEILPGLVRAVWGE